eukprot:gene20845-biopygen17007
MPNDWETRGDFPDKHEWPEFFHMPVLMLVLITLLNDGTLIAIGYDHVEARQTPEKWNLTVLYIVSSVLAFVALVSSIILLFLCLDSWNSGFCGGLSYGQITSAIYLKVSISDFLTLFSARTNENWFWSTAPAPILLGAGCLALTISTVIACAWPETYPDGVYTVGLARRKPIELALYVWLYCIAWWFVQDGAKVLTFHILKKNNYFGYNDTGKLVLPASTLKYIQDNKAKDMVIKKTAHH